MQISSSRIGKYIRHVLGKIKLLVILMLLLGNVNKDASAQTFSIDISAASPLTGLWWNANESGWGASITQQSDKIFVAMYVYDVAANATWYTMFCTVNSASCAGDLLRNKGGATPTAPWNGSGISTTKVGTMTLQFASNDAATMSYTLDGLSTAKQISRFIFGPLPPVVPGLAGTWFGAIIETRSNCTQPQNNGGRATYGQYDIGIGAGPSGAISISLAGVTGLQCTYSGSYSTNGARLNANGNVLCNDGKRGTWKSTNIAITAKSMTLELDVKLDTTETCNVAAILGGVRQ